MRFAPRPTRKNPSSAEFCMQRGILLRRPHVQYYVHVYLQVVYLYYYTKIQ